jgi:hypothetical protein
LLHHLALIEDHDFVGEEAGAEQVVSDVEHRAVLGGEGGLKAAQGQARCAERGALDQ